MDSVAKQRTLARAVMDFRKFVCDSLNYSGVLALARRIQRADILILMFHSVVDFAKETSWKPLRDHLSVSEFSWLLDVLGNSYDFVSMDEAVTRLTNGSHIYRPLAVVTFDDGYLNNIDIALPVLEQRGIPAIVYLATEFVESQIIQWADRLDFAIQQIDNDEVSIVVSGRKFLIRKVEREVLRKDFAAVRSAIKSALMLGQDIENVEEIVSKIEQRAGTAIAKKGGRDMFASFMKVSEVQRLASHNLVSFGCHTRSHAILTNLPIEVQRTEIMQSMQDVNAWTGRKCKHFAYPNGDFSEATVALVEELGLESAVTTIPGLNPSRSDPFRLRRFHLPFGRSRSEILSQVANVDAIFSSAKKLFS